MQKQQILDTEQDEHLKPFNLGLFALLLILMGGIIGVTTNAINVIISPLYFQVFLNLESTVIDLEHIGMYAFGQGLAEGTVFGIIFSCIFTIGFAVITKLKADWNFVKNCISKIVITIYKYWFFGGIAAIILAFAFPESYDNFIIRVPQEAFARMGYAWVGGSIWGSYIGAVIGLIRGLIYTRKEWKVYQA